MVCLGEVEHRAAAEVRAVGRRLEGIAAPFDQIAHVGGFDERILPGAFGYLQGGQKERLTALHADLIDAYRGRCADGWHTGPDDGYSLQ